MAASNLLLSVLAMDAYNQGYNAGIDHGNTNIGGAIRNDEMGDQQAQDAGFYAAAYELNGEIIISYRGTDGANDVWNGWIDFTGGVPDQALLATQFYHSVKDIYPDANITLTGHSLGGGLESRRLV